jgi:hypothetical protein
MTLDQSPSIYPEDYPYTDEAQELREIREMRKRFYDDEEYDDEIDEYCSVRRLVPPPIR